VRLGRRESAPPRDDLRLAGLSEGGRAMNQIAEYPGGLLNHLETLYKPGDRALAIELVEALGCVTADTGQPNDTGSTYIYVHPNPSDRNRINNVLYLSEMRAEQVQLEQALANSVARDAALRSAVEVYREKARNKPYGIPHFGLRYPSFESIEPVLERLENGTSAALRERISLRVIRPDDPIALTPDLIQAFVYTDVLASGVFLLGQVIELQAQKSPS
jgi:hypothetical protein